MLDIVNYKKISSLQADVGKKSKKTQVVNRIGNNIKIAYKYDDTHDCWVEFDFVSVNLTLQLKRISTVPNANKFPSDDFSVAPTVLQNILTDFIGPIIMLAKANGDGATTHNFTGGWHGTNGDQTGNKTAFQATYTITADGVSVEDGDTIYADRIDIHTGQLITAYNTTTLRHVVVQDTYYAIVGGAMEIYNTIRAVEDITIETYYGLQLANYDGASGTIRYVKSSAPDTRYLLNVYCDSGAKVLYPDVDRMCGRSANGLNDMVAWIDKTIGLGDFTNCVDLPIAFSQTTGKTYFNLINNSPLDLNVGQIVTWHGGLIFCRSKHHVSDIIFDRCNNGIVSTIMDNPSGVPYEYLITKSEQVMKKINVLSKDNTINLTSPLVTDLIGFTSTGAGTIEFTIG